MLDPLIGALPPPGRGVGARRLAVQPGLDPRRLLAVRLANGEIDLEPYRSLGALMEAGAAGDRGAGEQP